MKIISFEISAPSSLNVALRTNRFKRNAIYKTIYQDVYYLTLKQKPLKPIENPRLLFIRYGKRLLDHDNFTASLKPVVDGLKHAGIIVDDTWERTGPWLVDQKKVNGLDRVVCYVYSK